MSNEFTGRKGAVTCLPRSKVSKASLHTRSGFNGSKGTVACLPSSKESKAPLHTWLPSSPAAKKPRRYRSRTGPFGRSLLLLPLGIGLLCAGAHGGSSHMARESPRIRLDPRSSSWMALVNADMDPVQPREQTIGSWHQRKRVSKKLPATRLSQLASLVGAANLSWHSHHLWRWAPQFSLQRRSARIQGGGLLLSAPSRSRRLKLPLQ